MINVLLTARSSVLQALAWIGSDRLVRLLNRINYSNGTSGDIKTTVEVLLLTVGVLPSFLLGLNGEHSMAEKLSNAWGKSARRSAGRERRHSKREVLDALTEVRCHNPYAAAPESEINARSHNSAVLVSHVLERFHA